MEILGICLTQLIAGIQKLKKELEQFNAKFLATRETRKELSDEDYNKREELLGKLVVLENEQHDIEEELNDLEEYFASD